MKRHWSICDGASLLIKLKYTCVGDEDSYTFVDVSSRCRDDTPVHVFITFSEWCNSYSEDCCFFVISNEDSVVGSVPRCLYHYCTEIIPASFAQVLFVFFELKVVPTRDRHRSTMCSCYLLRSRQCKWVHCKISLPQKKKQQSCKIKKKRHNHMLNKHPLKSYSKYTSSILNVNIT